MRRRANGPITALTLLVALLTAQRAHAQIQSGTWTAAGPMSQPRWSAAAALLADGRMLISGGFDGSGALASAEIYSSGQFAACAPMAQARGGHTAVTLADGRVLIAGGESDQGTLNSLEIFDPATLLFGQAGALSSPRKAHGAAVLPDNRVLI